MTQTQLQRTVSDLLADSAFVEARPYLEVMVERFEDEGPEIRNNLIAVYYYLGVGYMVEYSQTAEAQNLNKAIEWFTRLDKEFPDNEFTVTLNLTMADAHRGLQQFDKAAAIYQKLLSSPLEVKLDAAQRMEAMKKISEAYYIQRNWTDGIPMFEAYLKSSKDPRDKANAAAALMEAYIEEGKFEETLELLPTLVGDTASRYRIQLNIALIDAGDRLSAARRYNEAMLMYRMVLSVADIIAWQEQQLASITTQLDRLKLSGVENERMVELETEKFNTEAQLQALRKLTPYEADLQIRIARTFFLTGRDWESFYAYRDLIERYPDNANIEDFIYAAFTAASELQLTDDVIALGQFYKEDPQRTKYLSDITLKLAQYYLDSGDYENFYVLARSFINKNPTDPYAAQILYMMGSFYLQQGRLDDILVEFNDYLILYPDSAVTEGCHYWIGLADIFIGDYDDALVQFSAILEKYPRSIYSEDALYRRGIAYFGKQDFENAQQDFRTFVETYPSSTLRGEVEFFIADGYAATGQMKAALRHYAAVEQYTDSPTFIRNSYFNRAKLFEANNRYDEMAEILTAYMTKYEADGDLAGALFELGRARELQGSPELMLEDYSTGIMSFGNDPKAYGIDYIIDVYAEKYHENLNRIDQNIAFFDSIVNDKKFREKIITDRAFLFEYLAKNPAIDEEIQRKFYNRAYREALRRDTAEIEALLTKNRELNARYPKELPVDTFKRLSSEAADKNLRTLALRLDMALDELGAETESGRLFTRRDISAASPETLIWIGQQTSSYDPELALSAYQTVIDKHPDVEDSRLTALLALAALAVEAESYEEAQGYYLQAIQEFPAHPDTVDAMLGQANALLNQKKFEEAREKYVEITNRREWRGEPQAEALFQIGLTHYENGLRTGDPEEFKKAQAFFQRVYIGYFAFTDWAAAAYYYSGQTLKQLGNPQDARSTYEEFLKDNTYADTEYYDRIQDAMSTL